MNQDTKTTPKLPRQPDAGAVASLPQRPAMGWAGITKHRSSALRDRLDRRSALIALLVFSIACWAAILAFLFA